MFLIKRRGACLSVGLLLAFVLLPSPAKTFQSITSGSTTQAFRAIADCGPTSGPAPLTVRFRSRGVFSGGSIVRYRWDFEGGGTFETDNVVPSDFTHTFPRQGLFPATLEVTNNVGQTVIDTCVIEVTGNPPRAAANAAPSNGQVPLLVDFTCEGRDRDGTVVLYEWDFEGDGVFDFSTTKPERLSHTYTEVGTFAAVCRVTDNDEMTTDVRTTQTVIRAGPRGTPSVEVRRIEDLVHVFPITTKVSSAYEGYGPERAFDGNLDTSWFTAKGDATNLGKTPFYEVSFPLDVTVVQINMRGNRESASGYDFFKGRFDILDAAGAVLFSQEVDLPAPDRDIDVDIPDQTGVRRVRFTALADEGPNPGFAEIEILGPTLGPVSGHAPLTVSFDGSAADDGTVVLWEWDFDGDGVFDFSSPDSPATVHQYTDGGIFAAALRATDNDGRRSLDTIEVTVIVGATLSIPNDTPPTWPPGTIENLARIIPVTTKVSSSFQGYGPERAIDGDPYTSWFTAAGDAANLEKTPFYEVIFPIDVTVSQIHMQGNHGSPFRYDFFQGRFDLFDATGTALFSQDVDLPAPSRDIALDFPDQTGVRRVRFTGLADKSNKPGVGELRILGPVPPAVAEIKTTISGTVPVSIFLKDQSGTVLRRLVTDETRTGGRYTDLWDGTDDHGNPLPSGVYFAILEYVFADETRQIDLTYSTGGARYNPERNKLPEIFRPFENDLLTINFTIPPDRGASEALAFMGLREAGTRFITLLERVPFGVGTHTVYWDGFEPDGNFAIPPPKDGFLLGLFGFTLPDNAILLQRAPVLSHVSVHPNYFDPSTPDFMTPANPTATVMYDLDERAHVELTVTNLKTGHVLRQIERMNVPAGTGHTITWDGRADGGRYADKGDYRLALQAVDTSGSASLVRFALVRVFY